MPSIFSRKNKSVTRPPSGVPADFGHTRGGLSHLIRNETPEAILLPPPPPPPVQKDAVALPPTMPNGNERFGPGYGSAQPSQPPLQQQPQAEQMRNSPQQSASLPDARQRLSQQQQKVNGNSATDINANPMYARSAERPTSASQQPNGAGMSAPVASRTSEQSTRPTSGSSSFWSKRALSGLAMFPRRGFSAALNENMLYWFGGKSDGGLQNDLNTMDTATWEVRRVEAIGAMPTPREGHSAAFIRRTMFVFGGQDAAGKYDETLYAYNMANFTWYKVPMKGPALAGRKGHTTVTFGSKLFIFGGTADGHFLNDLVSFDVKAAAQNGPHWDFSSYQQQPAPAPRAGHSCSMYPGSIFVFGGMDSDRCYNDLWEYSMETRQWTQVTPNGATPPARYGHASAVVDDCIVIMGGRTLRGEPLNDFFAYKISSQRWYTFQVNASTWPHQIDPIFSLVKTRLLLYSGSMLRDETDPMIYSLDTSKIKIQPDGPRAPPAQTQQQSQQQEAEDDKNRRHRSMLPQQQSQMQGSPQNMQLQGVQQGGRAVSMVAGSTSREQQQQQQLYQNQNQSDSGIPRPPTGHNGPRPLAPNFDINQSQRANMSVDSFEVISPQANDDPDGMRGNSSWASQNGGKGRAQPRRSIVLNQSLINTGASPPVGPAFASASMGSLGALSNDSLANAPMLPPTQSADDRRLTIQLRNRNSAAILSGDGSDQFAPEGGAPPQPGTDQSRSIASNGLGSMAQQQQHHNRNSAHMSISSEHKDALVRTWTTLENKYAYQRSAKEESVDGSTSVQSMRGESLLNDEATRVLGVLLGMRRELAETKQQLSTVSRVAIERVAEAERGRKAALQEAIFLKAKASALTAGSVPLLGKLNTHRIHELERLYANTLNDNDALRNQLAGANLALKQSHDALAEFKTDAELTRRQLRELELLQAEEQPRQAEIEKRFAEKDAMLQQMAAADADRTQRLEAAMMQVQAAQDRADRIQTMHAEALARIDTLSSSTAELQAEADRQRSQAQRSRERAADFERLWTESRDELSSSRGLRANVDQLEAKDRRIAELEQQLADASPAAAAGRARNDSTTSQRPRGSFSSDNSDVRTRELHAAYLAAHRQWSEARDELLSLKNALREANDLRHDAETKVSARERELSDVQARLSAFTALLQEYADRQQMRPKGDLKRGDDDSISVQSMLAAIQQLQRTSSIATGRPSIDAVKPSSSAGSNVGPAQHQQTSMATAARVLNA
ncbi:hypothetical protein LPJ66_005878 [Kickxella alabastrina]|uniref:Uncharacterized protein n=1 Tax=Kickxella alabastrina TaxID=61397 RepID=A0ACC1IEP3_9FUNG|nr:hypothetical protein LPJ66_005878 [Kickxella alabastrina]